MRTITETEYNDLFGGCDLSEAWELYNRHSRLYHEAIYYGGRLETTGYSVECVLLTHRIISPDATRLAESDYKNDFADTTYTVFDTFDDMMAHITTFILPTMMPEHFSV